MDLQNIQLTIAILGAVAVTGYMVRNLLQFRAQVRLLRGEGGGVFVGPKWVYDGFAGAYILPYLLCALFATIDFGSVTSWIFLLTLAFTLRGYDRAFKNPALIRFDDSGVKAVTVSGDIVQANWDQIEATSDRAMRGLTTMTWTGQSGLTFRHGWRNADKLYSKLRVAPEPKLSGIFP